jgi:hypothetical protein
VSALDVVRFYFVLFEICGSNRARRGDISYRVVSKVGMGKTLGDLYEQVMWCR